MGNSVSLFDLDMQVFQFLSFRVYFGFSRGLVGLGLILLIEDILFGLYWGVFNFELLV